jgi:hypothetical protein
VKTVFLCLKLLQTIAIKSLQRNQGYAPQYHARGMFSTEKSGLHPSKKRKSDYILQVEPHSGEFFVERLNND